MSMAKVLLVVALASLLTAAAQTQTPKPTPKPSPTPQFNKTPSVKLVPAADRVVLPGCDDAEAAVPGCPATSPKVKLSARATDPDGDTLLYTYSTTGGRIDGEGPEVTLDLTGVAPGVYSVTVKVDDGNGGVATDSAKVAVERCTCDPAPTPPPCPTVTVSCPDTPEPDGHLVFKSLVTGGDPNVTPTFNWTVSVGRIINGQGTGSITVDMTGVNSMVTATVDVGGYDRSCKTANSCTLTPGLPPVSRKVDEYGVIKLKDEWARLDNYAAELRNDPTAQGFFVCYGGRRSTAGEAQRRCDRALRYTSARLPGADPRRFATVDAGYRCEPLVELWLVPSGAEPPADAPLTIPEPRPSAAKCRPPRRRARP